jgi:hypothetical protein
MIELYVVIICAILTARFAEGLAKRVLKFIINEFKRKHGKGRS